MDKLSDYRQIIQDILTAHSQIQPVYGEIEMELLFDTTRDRYQVLQSGWLQRSIRRSRCGRSVDFKRLLLATS
jgi:XisI protein